MQDKDLNCQKADRQTEGPATAYFLAWLSCMGHLATALDRISESSGLELLIKRRVWIPC